MSTIYLDPFSELAKKLSSLTGYTGKNFTMDISDKFYTSNTYWEEGYKHTYILFNVLNDKIVSLPSISPFNVNFDFSKDPINFKTFNLPVNIAVIDYQEGNREKIHLTIHPTNSVNMLPKKTEDLSRNEKIVLYAIKSLKSSYSGIGDYRFYEAHNKTGISKAEYENAKNELLKKGMLDKRYAITISGKNAISGLYNFPD